LPLIQRENAWHFALIALLTILTPQPIYDTVARVLETII
jgi:hypothetical protein